MSNQLPILRKKFLQDPEYFKNVYKRVFELGKTEGAKVLRASHRRRYRSVC